MDDVAAVIFGATYTYTGQPFTPFYGTGLCPSQYNISGLFTTAQLLIVNQNGMAHVVCVAFSFYGAKIRLTGVNGRAAVIVIGILR